jgi:putative exosortase-associated protein (TIGR04073 family)
VPGLLEAQDMGLVSFNLLKQLNLMRGIANIIVLFDCGLVPLFLTTYYLEHKKRKTMKKLFLCLLLLVGAVSVNAQTVWTCSQTQQATAVNPMPPRNVYPNPGYGITRGFANVMFGWLEIPRGFTYENSRIPLVGVVSGPIKGAFLTGWRTMAGMIDLVSFGMSQRGAYFSVLPDYVWDAPWIHRAQYRPTDPDQVMIYNAPRRVDGRPFPPQPPCPCGKRKCACARACQVKPAPQPCQLKPVAPARARQSRPARPAARRPYSQVQPVPADTVVVQSTEPFQLVDDEQTYSEMARNLDEQVLVIEGRAAMLE